MSNEATVEKHYTHGSLIDAIAAGVRAIIQPGGSVRDPEVIEAADKLGLAMLFTGFRHFRH